MELDGKFIREFEVESVNETLRLFQSEVGDESCVVWDAAIVLSKYLEAMELKNKGWLKNKKVIELGAGLGCVGLVAACLGADVVLTDLPKEISQLQHNIDMNENVWKESGGHATAVGLEWGSSNKNCTETPDILLVADCVYYEESIEPLIATMRTMSSRHTQIFLSQEERESEKQKKVWSEFLNAFTKHFDVRTVPQNEQHPTYSSTDICILHAEHKAKVT